VWSEQYEAHWADSEDSPRALVIEPTDVCMAQRKAAFPSRNWSPLTIGPAIAPRTLATNLGQSNHGYREVEKE
jgi:hypothetical protein